MRILFISKRHPQGRDLLARPYGRFYYIPKFLSDMGCSVHVVLIDYKGSASYRVERNGLSYDIIGVKSFRIQMIFSRLQGLQSESPCWIVGFSDMLCGILATILSKRWRTKLLIDAYDNFESYMPWALPIRFFWRKACSSARLITAAGPALAKKMGGGIVVPMSADPIFFHLDKDLARKRLNLPDGPLIGYFGSMDARRGGKQFLSLLSEISRQLPEAVFVVSGRSKLKLPSKLRGKIIRMGYVADEIMPVLMSAVDVSLAISVKSAFSDYAYPVKVYESWAVGCPIFVSRTDSVEWMLKDCPEYILDLNNMVASANKIVAHLKDKKRGIDRPKNTWEQSSKIMLDAMKSCDR